MRPLAAIPLLFIMVCSMALTVEGRDAARDLRKLIGYTIVSADTIELVTEQSGEKRIRFSNGVVFKVDFLLLDPLPLTDVIVFAKPLPKELAMRYQGKLPDRFLYSYKLLIDNEIFDATPQ